MGLSVCIHKACAYVTLQWSPEGAGGENPWGVGHGQCTEGTTGGAPAESTAGTKLLLFALCCSWNPLVSSPLTHLSLCFVWSSARPARLSHQRAQAGDGEEGGGPAAEPGDQRGGAERRTEGEREQKHKGQDPEERLCLSLRITPHFLLQSKHEH